MLERQCIQIAGLEILANAAAAQSVPAVIARDFIEPRGERARRIICPEFLAHLHEYFRGRVFCIFPRRQQPAAESENRRRELAIQLAPGVVVSRPDLGQQLCQIGVAHRPGGRLPVHGLIRWAASEYFTTITNERTCLRMIRLGPRVATGGGASPSRGLLYSRSCRRGRLTCSTDWPPGPRHA